MLVEPQKARSVKVHTITAADLATLASDFQDWLDARSEEVLVGVQFEFSAAGDNRVYILYTE